MLLLPLLVLLLAAAMRILGAGHIPFWSDEAWNVWAIDSGVPVMLERLAVNHHPPAFFLALDGWQAIAGESRLALRFLSIAAGMLTVALIYRIGKDHFGVAAGICAAALFAVFEQPVYYGQSVRHYAWLLLASALTLWLFLRALKRPAWPRFIAYGASVAFLMYTLYIGVIAVVVQAFVGLVIWRVPWRIKARLIAAYAGAVVVFAPWLIYALSGVLSKIDRGIITGYHNSIPTTLDGVTRMLDIVFGGEAALGLALVVLVGVGLSGRLALTPGPTPTLRGSLHSSGRGESDAEVKSLSPLMGEGDLGGEGLHVSTLTVLACGLGAVIFMALVNLQVGIVSERTLAYTTPAIALTLGAGLTRLLPRLRNILFIALVGWAILTPQNIIPRLNSGLAAQAVAEGYSPGDLVILETGFDDMAFAYELGYALPAVDRRIFPSFYEYRYPGDPEMLAALDAEIAASRRVWVVYWNVPPRMADRLRDAGFERIERTSVPVGVNDPLYSVYPEIDISLFARPDETFEPLTFGDQLRLDSVVAPAYAMTGNALHLDLYWTPLEPLDRDYTVALFLLDETGATRVEQFGPAADNPTSRWTPGQITHDRQSIPLPPDLPPGRYSVLAVVYWYQAVDAPLAVNGVPNTIIAEIEIVASNR